MTASLPKTSSGRCARKILKLGRELPQMPEDLDGLARALSDTYFCNFDVSVGAG